ncbi:MAG TPA: hypothetical protein VM120_24890 [Bryobacteraceae bacterium]|nr:hypothetical protein [Bryobacteraceae bacterium]
MGPVTSISAGQRIRDAAICLRFLDSRRSRDPYFGIDDEHLLIQRELIDLEMQDMDEQIRRVCETAH